MRIIIFVLLFNFSFSYSQSNIEMAFNEDYIGRNISMSWKKKIKSFRYSLGLKYHINRIDKIPTNESFKNTAYADSNNVFQNFGLQFGVEYYFFKPSEMLSIGLFYNNQTSLIDHLAKNRSAYSQLVENPQSEFDFTYVLDEIQYGPVLSIDNVLGVTIENKISDNMYLNLKGGFGILHYRIFDDDYLLFANGNVNRGIVFTSFCSIGVGYEF